MAMAHVCQSCGEELSRRRAFHDAEYRLRLVICPSCGQGEVRRRHPLVTLLRRVVRLNAALERLALQSVAVLLFGTLAISGTVLAVSALESSLHSELATTAFVLFYFVIVPIAMGAWLFAAFAHKPVLHVWIGWYLFMLAVLGLGYSFGVVIEVLDPDWDETSASNFRIVVQASPARALIATALLLLMMIIALGGIPLGLLARWSTRRFRNWRWAFRRRRKRLEVQSG